MVSARRARACRLTGDGAGGGRCVREPPRLIAGSLDGWNTRLGKSLSFSLSDYDAAPSGTATYVTVGIEAESGHFHGASACVLRETDLAAFLESCASLARGEPSHVALAGGWGTNEDVRIELFPKNARGHVGIRAVLGEVPNRERRDRLEAHFETEPASLLRFSEEVRRAVLAHIVTTIALYVVGGPAV